jgi:hypothetical protein
MSGLKSTLPRTVWCMISSTVLVLATRWANFVLQPCDYWLNNPLCTYTGGCVKSYCLFRCDENEKNLSLCSISNPRNSAFSHSYGGIWPTIHINLNISSTMHCILITLFTNSVCTLHVSHFALYFCHLHKVHFNLVDSNAFKVHESWWLWVPESFLGYTLVYRFGSNS